VVFFKLQLIAFFEGIRSERQLMDTVNLNLAHRWFIGHDLDEPVPDHSNLSKIRERFGLEVISSTLWNWASKLAWFGVIHNVSQIM
jgi:transposase